MRAATVAVVRRETGFMGAEKIQCRTRRVKACPRDRGGRLRGPASRAADVGATAGRNRPPWRLPLPRPCLPAALLAGLAPIAPPVPPPDAPPVAAARRT